MNTPRPVLKAQLVVNISNYTNDNPEVFERLNVVMIDAASELFSDKISLLRNHRRGTPERTVLDITISNLIRVIGYLENNVLNKDTFEEKVEALIMIVDAMCDDLILKYVSLFGGDELEELLEAVSD